MIAAQQRGSVKMQVQPSSVTSIDHRGTIYHR
jgi:hypothetical protein